MKNSNVHNRIARELVKSKPLNDFKTESRWSRRAEKFDNSKYLQAVKLKRPDTLSSK